jgi:NADPH-dependent glutamate synthase beta subunit-like oxidoreductase
MPAHQGELDEALDEGVTMRWLSTVSEFEGDHIVLEKMRLNRDGFPEATGEYEDLDADSLVLALGQDTDLALLGRTDGIHVEDGVIDILPSMMTGEKGIFAGGDAVPSSRTATVAIGHGKQAAQGIDAFLSGREADLPARHDLASFDRLNTWYYSDAPRTRRPELEQVRRQSTFDEVVGGLTEENALFEARRCLSCGNCFECDNCFGVCPDNAVIKLGPGQGYQFDLDFCKGCGICAQECPCGAIDMTPEQI